MAIGSFKFNFERLIKKRSVWLAGVVLLAALLPRVTTLGGTFIVNDETLYWSWSNEFIKALLRSDWHGTLVGKGYPAVTTFWIHGLGFAGRAGLDLLQGYTPAEIWHRSLLDEPFRFDNLGSRRLTMALANAWLIWFIYLAARQLMGRSIAFLGAILMAFAPFLLADARTMRGDALMSSLMLVSVLTFLLFLRKGSWIQLLLSAFSLGLALLTKITAIPVIPFAGLAMAVYLWRQSQIPWPIRIRWGLVRFAVWGVTTGATFLLLWPAVWVMPGEVLDFMRDYAVSSIDGRLNYFWGRLTTTAPLPLFYPVAFLFRATPLATAGLVTFCIVTLLAGWHWLRRRPDLSPLRKMASSSRWTLWALAAYSVIYWLTLTTGTLKRDRYLMPLFPAVMFIAAAGLLWLVKWVGQHWPGQRLPGLLARGNWAWLALFLLLGWQLGLVLETHPFYYTYWSPLLGGGRVAQGMMMAESGVETSALVALSEKPGSSQESVALLYTRDFAPAYKGHVVRLNNVSPWITADYVLLRQYHFQTEKLDPRLLEYLYRKTPEEVVNFQGYTWAWLYPGPAAQYYAGSQLDGQAKLLGYNLSRDKASPNRPLEIKLFWQNQGFQASDDFFVRLVDAGGFIWAETVAQPLPGFEPVVSKTGSIVESEAILNIPPGTPPGLYFLKMGLVDGDEPVTIGEFSLPSAGNKIVIEKTVQPIDLTLSHPVDQKLSHNLTLLGAELDSPLILASTQPHRATLYWQATRTITEEYVVALRLLDGAGQEAASWLGHPTHGLYPSSNWQQGDLIRDPWPLDLSEADGAQTVVPGQYTLTVTLLDGETAQEIGQADLGKIEVIDRQRIFKLPEAQYRANVRLGEAISLLAYDLSQKPLTGGARLTTRLYWQAGESISKNYTVFVQVLGPDGRLVGQHDSIPAAGRLPTTAWDVGEIISDRHIIDFPIRRVGEYRVIVGMYDPETGKRLPVSDAAGATGDFWQLSTFQITEEQL